jgi:hypothetical protein
LNARAARRAAAAPLLPARTAPAQRVSDLSAKKPCFDTER